MTEGERFRAAMKEANLTGAGFARLVGINGDQVYRWCNGKRPIPRYAWVVITLYQSARVTQKLAAELCNDVNARLLVIASGQH